MTQELTITKDAQVMANEAIGLLRDAESLSITTTDEYQSSAALLQRIKGVARDLDAERKDQTRPLDEQKKAIMDLYRQPLAMLEKAEAVIKRGVVAFQEKEREEARKRQLAAQQEAERQRQKLLAQAAKAEEKGKLDKAEELEERAMMTAAPIVAADIPKVQGISTRTVWQFEIVHPEELPREYLMANEQAIGQVVRALKGMTNIPGVRVWSEESIAAGSR